jgi:hypothetical protein
MPALARPGAHTSEHDRHSICARVQSTFIYMAATHVRVHAHARFCAAALSERDQAKEPRLGRAHVHQRSGDVTVSVQFS